MATDLVNGSDVYTSSGRRLGYIRDILIDEKTGRVAYAVLGLGGFYGFNERFRPVPWHLLKYSNDRNGFVLPLDRDVIENGPSFDHDGVGECDDDVLLDYYRRTAAHQPA
ncbi:MAG: PRC-barrel domain-containing protein [Alphaproteobacteria bacterium]